MTAVKQMSIFDLFEKSPYEQMIEWQLQRGSGFTDGKKRIVEKWRLQPSINEFAQFLQNEYGIGGFAIGEYSQRHDSKGIRMEQRTDDGDKLVALLNWRQVAERIGEMIADDNY